MQLGLNAFNIFVSEYVNQNVSMFIFVMVSRRWENRRFDCMGGWVLRCTAAILCSIYWNCNVSKVYWQWPLTMAYCRALYCKLGQFFKKLTIVLNRYNALSLNFGQSLLWANAVEMFIYEWFAWFAPERIILQWPGY